MNKNINELATKMLSICNEIASHNIFNDELTITSKPANLLSLINKLKDNTTDDNPQEYPSGIELVIVNGQVVFENGDHLGTLSGELIKL